jgi:hypothetical protein
LCNSSNSDVYFFLVFWSSISHLPFGYSWIEFFFLAVLGFELRASCLQGAVSGKLFYQPFTVLVIFEIGFGKLFAWGWLQTVILLISAS